ncbi:hypothetical protein KIW84_060636 [Lathyrus oleraceus]|uniref:Uncharacterized protein n=1 Tax=Pisum sativum TaxID=3888 RepID=A0A9D4W063_PEA|nr:hypothetical protein KIW84_060636 [Pisum sativum]
MRMARTLHGKLLVVDNHENANNIHKKEAVVLATSGLKILNNDSDVLDKILEVEEKSRNMKAIGFDYSSMNKKIKIPTKKFVYPKKKTEFLMKDHMSQHPAQHLYPHNRCNKNSSWRCHRCERYCHIGPFCYRLYGYHQSYS